MAFHLNDISDPNVISILGSIFGPFVEWKIGITI